MKKSIVVAAWTVLLALGAEAFAVTYYIDDNSNDGDVYTPDYAGNDSNDGLSPSSPKLTINNLLASTNLLPGDVVLIDTGTYTDNVVIGASVNGTATNRIAFQGSPDTRPWGGGTTFNGSGDIFLIGGNYLDFRDIQTVGGSSGFNLTAASYNEFERIYLISTSSHSLRSSGASNSNAFRHCVFHSTGAAAHALYAPAKGSYIENCVSWSVNSLAIGGGEGAISNIVNSILMGSPILGVAALSPAMNASHNILLPISGSNVHSTEENLAGLQRANSNWYNNTVADPKFANAEGMDFHLLSAAGIVSNGVWVTNAAVGYSPGIDFGARE